MFTKYYFADKIRGNEKGLKFRNDVRDLIRTKYFDGKT